MYDYPGVEWKTFHLFVCFFPTLNKNLVQNSQTERDPQTQLILTQATGTFTITDTSPLSLCTTLLPQGYLESPRPNLCYPDFKTRKVRMVMKVK
jgi:hypothetical protein